jgi:hypothetical protein
MNRARLVLVLVVSLFAMAVPAVAEGQPAPNVVSLFPSDELTVTDLEQITGRRIQLPLADCDTRPSDCHEIQLINQFDGFDLQPRIAIRFDGPVDLAAVTADTVYVQPLLGDGERIPVVQLVWDPATSTLYGFPQRLLRASTVHLVVVTPPVSSRVRATLFTTMSAPEGLLDMRRQLDDASAYDAAGIPEGDRGIRFDILDGQRAVFDTANIRSITRLDDTGAATATVPVTNTAFVGAKSYAFGAFLSPSWLTGDRVIPWTPTGGSGPAVTGREEVGVITIVPAGTPPPGGWPVAIFGHGFGSNRTAVFAAADFNARRGLATMAINVVGHGFGPGGTINLELDGVDGAVAVPAFGRGVDLDGNQQITSTEGVGAPGQPHPLATIGSRDGLRQTVADLMALVRAIGRGVDVDGDGSVDLRRDGVTYYGQSFGGIYGTMLGGTDPLVPALGLNVPGGPTVDITRLSPVFRPLLSASLDARQPSLLNGGYLGFTESLPLQGEAPVTQPTPGALAIQEALARSAWISRPGSPETFAPLLRLDPPSGSQPKSIIVQVAHGDRTVPNPTSARLVQAGRLEDAVTLYRNDRTPYAGRNPHGFLTDLTFGPVRSFAQLQLVELLATEGASIVDPDGPGRTFEVPVADPSILHRLNFPGPESSPAVAVAAASAG